MAGADRAVDETQIAADAARLHPGRRRGLVLLCEHAGRAIPAPWADLGLDEGLLATHYAYDLGARPLALGLARALDVAVVVAEYSRLFYDINRQVGDWECMRPDLAGIPVPGNLALSDEERARRERLCRVPFDDLALAAWRPGDALVSIHSFSPIFNGAQRRTEIGVLRLDGCPVGAAILAALRDQGAFRIGDNEPYDMRSAPSGTLDRLAARTGARVVAIEVCNEIIADEAAVAAVAAALAPALTPLAVAAADAPA
jgi:predicted N-formylglutamate amidohydrolase